MEVFIVLYRHEGFGDKMQSSVVGTFTDFNVAKKSAKKLNELINNSSVYNGSLTIIKSKVNMFDPNKLRIKYDDKDEDVIYDSLNDLNINEEMYEITF